MILYLFNKYINLCVRYFSRTPIFGALFIEINVWPEHAKINSVGSKPVFNFVFDINFVNLKNFRKLPGHNIRPERFYYTRILYIFLLHTKINFFPAYLYLINRINKSKYLIINKLFTYIYIYLRVIFREIIPNPNLLLHRKQLLISYSTSIFQMLKICNPNYIRPKRFYYILLYTLCMFNHYIFNH